MFIIQGATIFANTDGEARPHVGVQGATLFHGLAPSVIQQAQAIRGVSTAVPNTAPKTPKPWRGDVDPHWPYGSPELRLDQDGEMLQTEFCTCPDAPHPDWPVGQQCVTGHAHTHRVVCPVCLWYANVAADQMYPVPVHGGANNHCSGAYTLARSELHAYPIVKWPQYDPTPAYWIISNRWTSKYVADLQGNENPDVDRAHRFANETDATQFARRSQGTPIAHALVQPPPEGEYATCGWCRAQYPVGTIECASCLATCDPVHNPIEDLIRRYFDRGICSWVYVWAFNAVGQPVQGGGPL
jgi:hypothetical protein